jgi:4-amino-4-deoxy-L-arabinose transferase-like glycosyltransferase
VNKKFTSKKWQWTAIGGVVVLLSALFLRLYDLNLIPVFADEAIYIRWAQIMRVDPGLRFVPLSDGKQPLFMWIVIPFLKFISDPLVAGRVVSVIFGLGTTVGVFVLSYIMFNSRKVSLFASLLYALSPFAVFFDRMALVDSMLSFFGVWSLTLAILSIKYQRLDAALLAGFALGGGLLTKSPALFFILLLPSILLFAPLKKKSERLVTILKSIALLAVSAAIGYGFYNILRLGENFHMIAIRNLDYVFPINHFFESPTDPMFGNIEMAVGWLFSMAPLSLIVLAVVGAVINFPKKYREVLVLIAWFMIPLAIEAEYSRAFTARYIFFTLPPLVVLASSVLKKFKKAPRVYIAYALAMMFFVQVFVFYFSFFYQPAEANWPERDGYLADWTAGTGIREATKLIIAKRDANPDAQIVVGTEGYFGTLPDGAQIYLEGEENIVVIGTGIDLIEVPESLVESSKAGNITYLMANSSRLEFENFNELGLIVVDSWEKASRTPGTHGYINDGPQDTFYLFEVTNKAI